MGRTLQVAPGEYRPADATVSYTWLRDGERVGTGPRYPLTVRDVGERVSLRVGLSRPGYRNHVVVVDGGGLVMTTPALRVTAEGKAGRAVVRVRAAAPGVETVRGQVTVRVGRRDVTGRLVDGRLRAVVDGLAAGRRTVRVAYAGTEVVRPGRTSTTVRILRR
jgi:hypothetical protein